MKKIKVIKVGGAILENESSLTSFLENFSKIEGHKILVHGGGRSATEMARRLGIETVMVEGRRITDDAMLEVVTMVYGGLVNKNVVAKLQERNINAIGVTGADMNMIMSERRALKNGIDYGNVGDVREVNALMLERLIDSGATPVIAPLTHDGKGNLLNTNADTIAAEVAKALGTDNEVKLIYCFEKPGVLSNPDDDSSVIKLIDQKSFEELKNKGTITAGMIPKLENAFDALSHGVEEVIITSVENIHGGTHITSEKI